MRGTIIDAVIITKGEGGGWGLAVGDQCGAARKGTPHQDLT